MPGQANLRIEADERGRKPQTLLLQVRARTPLDKAQGHTAMALGLGTSPRPDDERVARRLGLGLFGTLASIIWMWSLLPPTF